MECHVFFISHMQLDIQQFIANFEYHLIYIIPIKHQQDLISENNNYAARNYSPMGIQTVL